MIDVEENYEVEVILRHTGKGASHLNQVLWKGYPINEASWKPESYLQNYYQILEDYLHHVAVEENVRQQTTGRKSTK